MDLTQVILGPITTEKSERLKASPDHHVYTMRVHPDATKIEIKNAIARYYDVHVEKVRIVKVQPKTRSLPTGGIMEKRHGSKKALVTLKKKSKPLDLVSFEIPS
jgi:large subunit ribosomal protein L23